MPSFKSVHHLYKVYKCSQLLIQPAFRGHCWSSNEHANLHIFLFVLHFYYSELLLLLVGAAVWTCVCVCSGGVMIYFDRVEVVNVLSASAGWTEL